MKCALFSSPRDFDLSIDITHLPCCGVSCNSFYLTSHQIVETAFIVSFGAFSARRYFVAIADDLAYFHGMILLASLSGESQFAIGFRLMEVHKSVGPQNPVHFFSQLHNLVSLALFRVLFLII